MDMEKAGLEFEYASMPLERLAAAALQNYQYYLRRQPADNAYALELFRRAFCFIDAEESQMAWSYLIDLYQPRVQSWVRMHRRFANSGEEVDIFVNGAFGRFYSSFARRPEAFVFDCLEKVLAYLKMCVHSELEDHAAGLKVEDELTEGPWDEKTQDKINGRRTKKNISRDGQESQLSGSDEALFRKKEFWEAVKQLLPNEYERVAVFARFHDGLDDKEIAKKYPGLFENARQVANIRGNVIERFKRHKSDLTWLFER